jgi:DNA-directed RNA polymerase subunit RPC12/RpoP
MNGSKTGVLPLVCVICKKTVGVINTASLEELLDSGDAYICNDCGSQITDDDAAGIEAHLAACAPTYYADLVNQAIASLRDDDEVDTYIVTVKVMLETEAADVETAIELAQNAVRQTQFCNAYKMVSLQKMAGLTKQQDQAAETSVDVR